MLVFMAMYVVKVTFFNYDATEAVSYNDYSGSIHVGIDTLAGDYYLQNSSNVTGDLKYGIRTDESQPFTIVPYSDNQIVRLNNGDHIIIYHANLFPIQTTSELAGTSAVTQNTTQTEQGQVSTITDIDQMSEGMIKLSASSYNIPYVLAPQSDKAFYKLYDRDLNVTQHLELDGETLLAIAPDQASYIQFSDTTVSPLASYTTTGGLSGTGFTPAVYVGGETLEAGNFELIPTDDTCRYRLIDDLEQVATTEYTDCLELPILLTITDGQVLEVHGATIEKYFEDVEITAADAGESASEDTTEQ